ncbi:MAG: nicotinate-nucleotide adenylyltransferase [Lysobacterales bacterium]
MTERPLALLGGSFDPVHHGHLRMALEAAQALDAVVALLPSGIPPHRASPTATPAQRLTMIELALAGQDRIAVDARELARSGPNYTVDTLREVRAEVGAQRPLVLLIGTDQFGALDRWHEWRSLFEFAHVGVLDRVGVAATPSGAVNAFVSARWITNAESLRSKPAGMAIRIVTTALDISASRIRADLAAGRSPRWLLPDPVLDYIHAHGLYLTPGQVRWPV